MSPPSLSGLTMVLNSCFLNFMHLLASYIKNLMLRLLNKMPVLKENTNTFLMLVEPFFSNSNFLLLIGHMLYFMQSFLSIESLLQFFRTNPPFQVLYNKLHDILLSKCLVVCAMHHLYKFT